MAQAAEYGGPVRVLSEGASEDRGERAKLSNIIGAIAIADLVKSTLGPKGMDKILQSASGESVSVTNDGATILKALFIDNPAAKILVDISKTQDDEVGDGTTSVCVFAGELLRQAEDLLQKQKIHPQTIIEGWRMACNEAKAALIASSIDHSSNAVKFREDLVNIAKTTLSSKILQQDITRFAELAVDAVMRLKGSTNLERIQLLKKVGGNIRDSYLEDGFILDKKFGVGQAKRIENAKILVANTPMDTDKIKIMGARVKTSAISTLAEIEQAEKEKMIHKCEKIVAHGCNIFINRQLIYNVPEQYFTSKGISSIEHSDFEGTERLGFVLGADIVSTFDTPSQVRLGTAKLVEEVMIGEDHVIRFSGVGGGEACTIVLRGASQQILDEADRSLHDALCVLTQTVKHPAVVLGGGCSEMIMAKAVEEKAKQTPGKKAIAMEAFAHALRQIPAIIADNGGYDSTELVSQLRAAHYQGKTTAGLDMKQGKVGDVRELGITEALKVKMQVLISASEASELILRVDDILRSAPRQRRQ